MTDTATAAPTKQLAPIDTGSGDMLANPMMFEHMQRVAKVFVASALIPDHLKKNNGADAFLALQIARERGENPVTVMQNIYFVGGKAGWHATYMIARANKCGTFKGPIRWRVEGAGEALKVTAWARMADDGEVVDATASMAMAKAEGWTRNAKYSTMPDHMLKWRSATMLIRLYCPEVLVGMSTADELEDLKAAGHLRDITTEGHATTAQAVGALLNGTQNDDGDHDPATGEIKEIGQAATPAAAVGDRPASDGQPETVATAEGAAAPAKRSWKLAPDIIGQEPMLKAIMELLGMTETEQEVDDLQAEHQAFIDKLGRLRAQTVAQFSDRRATLGKAP